MFLMNQHESCGGRKESYYWDKNTIESHESLGEKKPFLNSEKN